MTDSPKTPAGWYPAQGDPAQEVYWDGAQWTNARRPVAAPAQPTPAAAASGPTVQILGPMQVGDRGKLAVALVGGVVGVLVIAGLIIVIVQGLGSGGNGVTPASGGSDQSAASACEGLADEVMDIDSKNGPSLIKVRQPTVDEDHRDDYTLPTGTEDALVLSCTGAGVLDSGGTVSIVMKSTIDSDGDAFVSWEQAPPVVDTAAMERDLLAQLSERAPELGLKADDVATWTADCSSVTEDTLKAYYSCTVDDGVAPAEFPVVINPDGTYAFTF